MISSPAIIPLHSASGQIDCTFAHSYNMYVCMQVCMPRLSQCKRGIRRRILARFHIIYVCMCMYAGRGEFHAKNPYKLFAINCPSNPLILRSNNIWMCDLSDVDSMCFSFCYFESMKFICIRSMYSRFILMQFLYLDCLTL